MSDPINDIVDRQGIKIGENVAIIQDLSEVLSNNNYKHISVVYIETPNTSWYKILNILYYFPCMKHLFILTNSINGSIKTFIDIINNFQCNTLLVKNQLFKPAQLVRWNEYICDDQYHVYLCSDKALDIVPTKLKIKFE